jgi:8-oxo-dGTP pyrophosphatase MutT (NUDIX family)
MILVAEYFDPSKQQVFYRPLGGAIEFGERGADALAREMREELGAQVQDLRYLTTFENIFVYNGRRGHEIVLVYEGEFADPTYYKQSRLPGKEDDDTPLAVVWKPLTFFQKGSAPLYPDGLLEFLLAQDDTSVESPTSKERLQ